MKQRLTPQRRIFIESKKFSGLAKKIIGELLYEIDQLVLDILDDDDDLEEEYEHDDAHEPVYQKFQEQEEQRDKLKSILKTRVDNPTATKFFTRIEKK